MGSGKRVAAHVAIETMRTLTIIAALALAFAACTPLPDLPGSHVSYAIGSPFPGDARQYHTCAVGEGWRTTAGWVCDEGEACVVGGCEPCADGPSVFGAQDQRCQDGAD